MPKQVIQDAFGELLEIGKATAKAAQQVVTGLDMAERGSSSQPQGSGQKAVDPEAKAKAQIERLKKQDASQSAAAYKQIQDQIQLLRRQKASQPRKYVVGVSGYDEQQHKDPETFFDKLKKIKEKAAAKLPWTSKQGMGTGEIRRGTSG